MKGTEASVLVVLSSLAALTRARELQIDDVPVACATICGPVVELSYKCDVDNSFDELRRLKRRKVDAVVEHGTPHPKARRHHHRRPNQDQAELEATPTSPPDAAATDGNAQQQQPVQDAQQQQPPQPQEVSPVFIATLPLVAPGQAPQPSTPGGAQPTPSEVQQVTPTSVLVDPVLAQPTPTVFLTVPTPSSPQVAVPASPLVPSLPPPPRLSAPPAAIAPPRPPPPQQQQAPPAPAPQVPAPAASSPTSSSSSPPPPQTPLSTPTAVPVTGEGPGKKEPDQKPLSRVDTAERDCICGNKSFDVNLVAGMCQSCIRKSGNRASDMDLIMGQCNFAEATYTPDRDELAYYVRVVAQKPLLSHSGNAMGDAGRIGGGCALAAAAAAGFVAGLVLLM